MTPLSTNQYSSFWQWLSCALLLALAVWSLLTFQQHGISNDEYVQHTYGQLLLHWYQSGFEYTAAFHFKNLYLYGGLFDLLAAGLEALLPMWVWDVRHLLSAVFGWLGFYGVYRLSYVLDGSRLGALAICLLFLTASWSGTMFTHTKDIPFATCMLWACYASVFVARDLEKTALKHLMLLGLSVGAALGLRIGGAFAVLQLFLILAWVLCGRYRQQAFALTPLIVALLGRLLPAALLAFVIMVVCWPWSVTAPDHMLQAVKSFSHFAFSMETIANGHVYKIGEVPRSYLFQYLWIKLPEVVLLGLMSALMVSVFAAKRWPLASPTASVAMRTLLVSVCFPLAFVCYDKPALYNGIRHFTFLLPLLIVLAAWGLLQMWQMIQAVNCTYAWVAQAAWLGVILGLSAVTLQDMAALHPYEYMHLNRFAGNPHTAQYRWEGDYWFSALREAAPQLTRLNLPKREHPYLVAVCAESEQGQAYLDHRFQVTKNWEAADFFISGTNMHCHEVLKGDIIGTVTREGMLLAVVKDRRHLRGEDRYATPAKN